MNNVICDVGFLNVSSSQITLSSTNHIACFNATFPVDNEVCDGELGRSFVLQLTWTHGDQYTVNIHQQNLTVFIDDGKATFLRLSIFILVSSSLNSSRLCFT